MDVFGLRHLVNILYREDELSERIGLFHMWSTEKELTLNEFTVLLKMCTEEEVQSDKKRRGVTTE